MPRYWYVFNGPQTSDGYHTLSNFVYYNNSSTAFIPVCNSSANICAVYSIGSALSKTGSSPTSISTNQFTRITNAKSSGASQLGPFGGLYVRVRPTP